MLCPITQSDHNNKPHLHSSEMRPIIIRWAILQGQMTLNSVTISMKFTMSIYRVRNKKVTPSICWQFSQQRQGISVRNFIHLFIHHVSTCRYQQHLIVEQCLKIIGVAGMPPSDFRAFRRFLNKTCARKNLRYCKMTTTGLPIMTSSVT